MFTWKARNARTVMVGGMWVCVGVVWAGKGLVVVAGGVGWWWCGSLFSMALWG